jgi:hypothetical protein
VDAHSTNKFGLHQPRPSLYSSYHTRATTSRPLACAHVFDDLYDQDSVVGSDAGFGGFNDEGESDYFHC